MAPSPYHTMLCCFHVRNLHDALAYLAQVAESAVGTVDPARPLEAAINIENLKRLVCFAIPIYDDLAPIWGLPILPVPGFCTTPPTPPTPTSQPA